MKTIYQSTENGPVARAPSPWAGSRPKTGATPRIVRSEPGAGGIRPSTMASAASPPQ